MRYIQAGPSKGGQIAPDSELAGDFNKVPNKGNHSFNYVIAGSIFLFARACCIKDIA